MKNFLNISDLKNIGISNVLDLIPNDTILSQKSIGLLFEKPSTRTRLSFQVGIYQLGGMPINIDFKELNFSRKESFEDTFRAMNCYLDGLIYRTTNHSKLLEASTYFDKPIINALSDKSHPCQIIADLLTLKEQFGSLNITILWLGDMNNVCFSLIEATNLIDELSLVVCSPKIISDGINWQLGPKVSIINDINDIDLKSVKCVMTDVFLSMNDENSDEKINLLRPYCVDSNLMSKTNPECIFMHCLPAKVGYEVTEEVFRSPKSIVWKQAYNRMVAQKKLLQFIYQ